MSPIIDGRRKQIGWVLVPVKVPDDEIDWYAAQTFCLSCAPGSSDDWIRTPLYADDFPGDRMVCDKCLEELPFEAKIRIAIQKGQS